MGTDSERGKEKSFNLIELMTLNEIKCFTVALISLFGTMNGVIHVDPCSRVLGPRPPTYVFFMFFNSEK